MAKIVRDYSKLMHMFDSKVPTEHHLISKLNLSATCSIFEFLPPQSIATLSLSCKLLYVKTQNSLVWKNLFENYYKKKLMNTNSNPEIYNLLNADNFPSYKKACEDAKKYIGNKIQLTENQRDSIIGLFNVVIEETIESLLKLPHLLLLPAKIISYFISLIAMALYKNQRNFQGSEFFNRYLKLTFITGYVDGVMELQEYIYANENLYYNIQAIGILNVLEILLLFLCNILSSLYSIYAITIKIICLTSPRLPPIIVNLTYNEKINSLNKLKILYQYALTILVIGFHFWLLVYPTLYFRGEGLNNLIGKHFGESNLINNSTIHYYDLNNSSLLLDTREDIAGSSKFLNPKIYLDFLDEGFSIWWDKGFFGRPAFLFGPYCTNFLMFVFNAILMLFLNYTFRSSHVFVFDLARYIFVPIESFRYILNNPRMISFIVFPQIGIYRFLFRAFRGSIFDNKITWGIMNLITLILMFYPFYLNFKISFAFFRFFILNIYAITNLILVVKFVQ